MVSATGVDSRAVTPGGLPLVSRALVERRRCYDRGASWSNTYTQAWRA